MKKAFELIEDNVETIGMDVLREVVPVNDAYYACKLATSDELQEVVDWITKNKIESVESILVVLTNKIKHLKSKKVGIKEI